MKNRGLEGIWELLGATLRQKMSQKLSWPILVNFGRARIDQNLAQMGQDGANLEPSWRQEPQVGAKMVILMPFGELFGAFLVVLGAIFRKIAEV